MKPPQLALIFIVSGLALGCASGDPAREGPASRPAHAHGHHEHPQHQAAAMPAVDPICGMEVDPAEALTVEEGGQQFVFCSAGCQATFQGAPREKGQAFFDKGCKCAEEMPGCDCGHCSGKFEPCPCG